MRHVRSILLALVLAPAAWVLTGVGLVTYGRAGTRPDGAPSPDRLAGLAALLIAGLIIALLATTRLSPVGPVLAGLAYLAAAGWAAAYPVQVHDRVRELAVPFGAELIRPAEGYAVLLGVPLVATAFNPARWRRFAGLPALYAAPTSPISPVPASPAAPGGLAILAPPVEPAWPAGQSSWSAPADAWRPPPGWSHPAGHLGTSAPPMSPAPGANPARNADTEDLTAALLPLRAPHPPAP